MHETRLPRTPEERAAPLHSHRFSRHISFAKVREHIVPRLARSFDDAVERTCGVPPLHAPAPQRAAHRARLLSAADLQRLIDDGIIQRVSTADEAARPTRAFCSVFPVVETTDSGAERRRVIFHPAAINDALADAGYKPTQTPPLGFTAQYLHHAHHSYGVVIDLKCAFWQMRLRRDARQYYRFVDAHGDLYEATVAGMGQCSTVDLMQLVTAVVGGHPSVVGPCPATRDLAISVWVDGIFISGATYAAVERAIARAKSVADDVGATIKNVADIKPLRQLTFIGIAFDLERHTVALGDKTRGKLPVTVPATMCAGDVEKLTGRLLFASGVVQTRVVDYYFALKWAKRVCHRLNVGTLKLRENVTLGPATQRAFQQWRDAACVTYAPTKAKPQERVAHLFTDAAPTDFGAVLVMPDQRVFVTGARFDDAADDIAVREAQAPVFAAVVFEQTLKDAAIDTLHLRIDNTSVEAGLVRGLPRADSLAAPIRAFLKQQQLLDINVTVSRINSSENPADEPSRGRVLDEAKLLAALASGHKHLRRGAGRSSLTCVQT